MKNIGNLLVFEEPILFEGPVSFSVLPKETPDKFQFNETEPNVSNRTKFKAVNTSATLVTNFAGGQDGQQIQILGDGFTTIDHGTNIFNNTGADKLLLANKVYAYIQFDGIWYEAI